MCSSSLLTLWDVGLSSNRFLTSLGLSLFSLGVQILVEFPMSLFSHSWRVSAVIWSISHCGQSNLGNHATDTISSDHHRNRKREGLEIWICRNVEKEPLCIYASVRSLFYSSSPADWNFFGQLDITPFNNQARYNSLWGKVVMKHLLSYVDLHILKHELWNRQNLMYWAKANWYWHRQLENKPRWHIRLSEKTLKPRLVRTPKRSLCIIEYFRKVHTCIIWPAVYTYHSSIYGIHASEVEFPSWFGTYHEIITQHHNLINIVVIWLIFSDVFPSDPLISNALSLPQPSFHSICWFNTHHGSYFVDT